MIKGTRAWKRRQQALAAEAAEAASVVKPVVAPKATLPPGLQEMLSSKEGLQRYLQQLQKKPVLVSVDLRSGAWIYVVRGIRPPLAYWGDHEIWFTESANVWSPTKPLG